MKFYQTTKCIFCLKEAVYWSGILLKGKQEVSAGYCKKHVNDPIVSPYATNFINKKGCVGGWHEKYGIEEFEEN
jgi:hypothetical protein